MSDKPREWTVIYNNPGWGGGLQEVSPWRPGDGLNCTLGKRTGRVPCGRPAAVVRSYDLRNGKTPETAPCRVYVACANHLAQRAQQAANGHRGSYGAEGLSSRADREAREYVIERHWDEFVAKRDEVVAEVRDSWASILPGSLQQAVRDAVALDTEADEEATR